MGSMSLWLLLILVCLRCLNLLEQLLRVSPTSVDMQLSQAIEFYLFIQRYFFKLQQYNHQSNINSHKSNFFSKSSDSKIYILIVVYLEKNRVLKIIFCELLKLFEVQQQMQPLLYNLLNQNNQFLNLTHQEQREIQTFQSLAQLKTQLQDSPLFQYFVSKTKDKRKLIEIEHKYNKNLQQKLQNQIQEGRITVQKKKKINPHVKEQETEEEKYQRQRRELEYKKQILRQNLSRVLEEEKTLLNKNVSIHKDSKKRTQSHYEGMNPNWKQEVSLNLKKLKRFQEKLKQKNKSIEINIQNFRLRDIEKKMKSIECIKLRNRNQILQKHEKYKLQKQKEISERNKCQSLVTKMKPESYKFQKVEQMKRQQLQRKQQERKIKEDNLRKQRMTISRKELAAHQQAYLQILNERKQKWITQFEQFKASNTRIRHYSGLYLQQVIQEQNRLKEQKKRKQQLKIQAIQKVKEYSEYVKDCFKPKIATSQNPQKQQKIHLNLTRVQERKKGIENLKFIKEKIHQLNNNPLKEKKIVERTTSLPKLDSKTTYKDYLKEQPSRIKRQTSMKLGLETVISERKPDWLQNACTYIEKLQSKQNTKKGKTAIETAFRKLQLLNALY